MNTSHRVLNADRFPKLALYFALLVLPGGFIALLVLYWLDQRKRDRETARASAWVWHPPTRRWRQYRPNVWERV